MISYLIAFSLSHRSARRQPTMIKEVRFAPDSPLEKNRADGDDILGDAYEYLMRHFATESGNRAEPEV